MTKTRILDAATAEFAAHGLAGARVDRLADRAGVNKQLIYAYFSSKEGLFDATLQLHIDLLLDAVPFDPYDLPGYAVALFDFATTHLELLRLLRWHTLERPGELARFEQTIGSTQRKVTALAEAQAAGKVDATLPPAELLAVVISIAQTIDDPEPTAVGLRRNTVAAAVRRLVTPGRRMPSPVSAGRRRRT